MQARGIILTSLFVVGCSPTNPSLTGRPVPVIKVAAPLIPVNKTIPTVVAPPPVPEKPAPPLPPAKPMQFPARAKVAAVAFEDHFPSAGDSDFNDFLADFRINQKINEKNEITKITIEFYPRAVGGAWDHELLLIPSGVKEGLTNLTLQTPKMFEGSAKLTLSRVDYSGKVIDAKDLDASRDVVVFPSTHDLFGARKDQIVNTNVRLGPPIAAKEFARVEIVLDHPELNPVESDGAIDIAKYRMVLHVFHTDKYIDIIDVDPNNIDSNGNPFGFIIQADWQWPREGTPIAKAYPEFAKYQEFLSNRAKDHTLKPAPEVRDWFLSAPVKALVYPYAPLVLPAKTPAPISAA